MKSIGGHRQRQKEPTKTCHFTTEPRGAESIKKTESKQRKSLLGTRSFLWAMQIAAMIFRNWRVGETKFAYAAAFLITDDMGTTSTFN